MAEENKLYPPFGAKSGISRLQRLETGAQRLQRGQIRPTSGAYRRLPDSALFTKANSSQVVDLSRSNIRKVGGVSANGNSGGFGYVSSDTSITWYWDGTNGSTVPVVHRADGSSFTVPTSGSGLAITGLANTTDYYFLPFWPVNNLCNIGWVQGTTGSPQIAFTLADATGTLSSFYLLQQSLQGNEPLNGGFIKGTTAAGGGSGGGTFDPSCVRSGTAIKVLGDLPYECEVLRESQWVHLVDEHGRELYCTYDHPLYHAVNGKVQADTLVAGDVVITNEGESRLEMVEFTTKECSKYRVRMERGHLFYANGFLSHNIKVINGVIL